MGNLVSPKYRGEERIDGKTVIITGGNTGIGKYTALELCKRGGHIVIACRNIEKGNAALKWINEKLSQTKNIGDIEIVQLDLSSLKSVKNCAENLLNTQQTIDILINNAGIMFTTHQLTEDGYELQFATNHLGHYLFTLILLPRILASKPARIINLSSIAHFYCESMSYNDINMIENYTPFGSYKRSKAANVLFTRELSKRLQGKGVTVYAVHPGMVQTELWKNSGETICPGMTYMINQIGSVFMKSPNQGAQTTLYCALSTETAFESGFYYDNCKKKSASDFVMDPNEAELLYIKSAEMVNLELNPYDPFTPDLIN